MYYFRLGEIFWVDVPYDDEPEESKRRPVVIVQEHDEDILILVATTSISPEDPPKPFDHYKILLPNWRKSGLTKLSWALGLKVLMFTRKELRSIIKPKDFIGNMYHSDFSRLISKLNEFHPE